MTFPDEGVSPLDALPLRIDTDTTPASLARAWAEWARARGCRDWCASWRTKDPTVTHAVLSFLCNLPRTSGIQWVVTSDFRNSPSHKDGGAVDVAPRPPDWSRYAASRNIDPLLNGRADVLRHAQSAFTGVPAPLTRAVTAFIEDDHIHVHLHAGRGTKARLWPHRTHSCYKPTPVDQRYRDNPNEFTPRF